MNRFEPSYKLFPDKDDVKEFKIGYYYTPNLNHIHLAVSIILMSGKRICKLADGTNIDCRDYYVNASGEIADNVFGKLFHELIYFPLYMREMPDEMIRQAERVVYEKYFPKKIKIERKSQSPTGKYRSPDKKRFQIKTPSPKSSPEACVFSSCESTKSLSPSFVVEKKVGIKKSPKRFTSKVGEMSFRDLSHIAEGFFGSSQLLDQNKNKQNEITYDSSEDENDLPLPINMWRRMNDEIGEPSSAFDGTIASTSAAQTMDKNEKSWRDIIDSVSTEKDSSDEDVTNRTECQKEDKHCCKEQKCGFQSGNSRSALIQHMIEVHMKGEAIICSCGAYIGSKRNFKRHLSFTMKPEINELQKLIADLKRKGTLPEDYKFSHRYYVLMELKGHSPYGGRIRFDVTSYKNAFKHNSSVFVRERNFVINSRNKMHTSEFFG